MFADAYHRWLGLLMVVVVGIMGCSTRPATISAPTPTLTLVPTSTVMVVTPPVAATLPPYKPFADCNAITPQSHDASFPFPPHTISGVSIGAAGAGYSIECTPGATAAAIQAYYRSVLPAAGWRPFNQTTDQQSCGQSNSYWSWIKGHEAIGYSFTVFALPFWRLADCARVNEGTT